MPYVKQDVRVHIEAYLYTARTKAKEFAEYIRRRSGEKTERELSRRLLEQTQICKRLGELKSLFKRLYEDNVLGRISDEQFRILSGDYTDEKKALESRLPTLEKEIFELRESAADIRRFLDAANRYTVIRELTPEILRTFISKIVIHERAYPHGRKSPQQIDIHSRFIGNVFSAVSEKSDAEAAG
jgi:hypothetical protein